MLFDAVYEALPAALLVVQCPDLQICYCNPPMHRFLREQSVSGACFSEVFLGCGGEAMTVEALKALSHSRESMEVKILPAGHICEIRVATGVVEEGECFYVCASECLSDDKNTRLAFALNESCDGLWDWNAQTNEVYFSPKLNRMLGFEPGDRAPSFSGWYDLMHEQDAPRVMEALNKHLAGDTDFFDVEYRIYTRCGDLKQVRDRGQVCERGADGTPLRAVGMLSDMTAFRQMEQELRLTRDRFEDFARSGSDWFWETDNQYSMTEVSSQFSLQTGVSLAKLKGRDLIELLQEKGQEQAARAVTDRLPIRQIRVPLGDPEYWVSLSGRPVYDASGEFCGYRGIGENVHQQVMLERVVKAYQKNAEIMMDRAPVAISLIEDNGQFFYANDAFLKLLRADRDNLAQKYRQAKQLSRPDRDVLQSDESLSYEMVLETLAGPRFYSVLKYGLNRADSPTRVMVTMVMDITYTRQQEVEQKKIEMVLNNIAEGILITDTEHRIVSANRSLQQVTGYSYDELVGNTPALLSSGRHDRSFYQEMWNEVHQLGKWRGEIWNRCRNGAVIRQHVSIQAIVIDGNIQHYLGIYSSNSQLSSARDAEMFARQNDPLTGLPNRELFQDRLHMACQRSRVRHYPLEITVIRIVNLVMLNRQSGHVSGDQVLKRFAYVLQDLLDMDDTVSRSALDEFTILREGGKPGISAALDKLLSQPVVLPSGERIQPRFITASAVYPDEGGNASRLMRHLRSKVAVDGE